MILYILTILCINYFSEKLPYFRLALIAFTLLNLVVKRCSSYNIAKSMPGPHMYPIIGSISLLASSQCKTFQTIINYCNLYPNGFPYWSFGTFTYNVYSAESVERILTNPNHQEKSIFYRYLHNWLGTGLLTSGGKKWFRRRKLLTPAFHFSVLNSFTANFEEQTKILLREITKNELNRTNGTNLRKLISRYTLNVICESAMGVQLKKIDELDEYRNQIDRIGKLFVERWYQPWCYFDCMYNLFGNGQIERKLIRQAHEFTGNIIESKRKSFNLKRQQVELNSSLSEDENKRHQKFAMLDTLLIAEANENEIDAEGIQEEVDTFIFEGFDTTMTAINFILLMIANHPDVQQRLHEEITLTQDGHSNAYLNAVIKESLRLYPPIPIIGRVLGEDTVIDNVKLPAKTTVHIRIYALHRDPKYFEKPTEFNPDRFLEDDVKHPFAYIPFSGSKRNCIGQHFAKQELRTVVAEIVRNFELKPITKVEDIVILTDLVLRTKDPIRVKFMPRF